MLLLLLGLQGGCPVGVRHAVQPPGVLPLMSFIVRLLSNSWQADLDIMRSISSWKASCPAVLLTDYSKLIQLLPSVHEPGQRRVSAGIHDMLVT